MIFLAQFLDVTKLHIVDFDYFCMIIKITYIVYVGTIYLFICAKHVTFILFR